MKKEISCGAVIYRYHQNQKQFLLIKHFNGGHYGFPKGHMEHLETKRDTAKREVLEETNYHIYLIGKYYQKVTYSPKKDVLKDVYYYLGKVIDGDLVKQDEEIVEAIWLTCDEAIQRLIYDNDKDVLIKMNKKINRLDKDIRKDLMSHIESNILIQYQKFDKAHHTDHIYDVIYDSLTIAKSYDVNREMVYVIAAYHDIGLQYGRKTHHITSGDYLKNDPVIQLKFTNEEIEIMRQAIFDHRASNENPPQSIYGLIVAEADRQLNAKDIIYRTALYESSHHPNLSVEEQITYCYDHMLEKYSETGYLKLFLNFNKNQKELNKLREMIKKEEKIKRIFYRILTNIKHTNEKIC